jgi:hypothetical protein
MLSFLATRICLFKANDDIKSAQPSRDAKACCLVFLLATTKTPDSRLSDALKETLGPHKPLTLPTTKKAKRNSRNQAVLTEDDESASSSLPRLAATFPLAAAFIVAKDILLQPIAKSDDTPVRPEEEIHLLEALRDQFASATGQAHVDNFALIFSRILDLLVRIVRQKRLPETHHTPSMAFNELPGLDSTRCSSSLQESVVSSFKDTPPGPEDFSSVGSISEAPANPSLVLPFSQPLESPAGGSPWFGNTSQTIGMNNTSMLMAWPGQHKRQSGEVKNLNKRPRISCQEEFLDIPAGYADLVSRTEDDTIFTFDFLSTGNDISVFNMED